MILKEKKSDIGILHINFRHLQNHHHKDTRAAAAETSLYALKEKGRYNTNTILWKKTTFRLSQLTYAREDWNELIIVALKVYKKPGRNQEKKAIGRILLL